MYPQESSIPVNTTYVSCHFKAVLLVVMNEALSGGTAFAVLHENK